MLCLSDLDRGDNKDHFALWHIGQSVEDVNDDEIVQNKWIIIDYDNEEICIELKLVCVRL